MSKLIDITGKAISGEWGNDDAQGTGIPVLRTTNFTNDGIINFDSVITRSIPKKDISEKYLRHGDIIIEKSGGSDNQPVGRVVFFEDAEQTYLFNNFTGVLRVRDTSKWLPKYVFWALYANYRRGGTKPYQSKTTGLHNLQTNQYVCDTAIVDLPFEEQKKVVSNLDALTVLISLRKKQLQKLDDLVKARFVEMFGDMETNPMVWRESTVGTECYYIKDGPHKSPPYIEDGTGIPFISTRNVVNGDGIDWSTAKYISESDYEECIKKCKPEQGDILYSKGGTTGIAKLVDTNRRFANWVHVAVLKFGDQLNGRFFERMLNMDYCYQQSQKLTKGIANRDFVLSAIAQVKIFVPPIELQQEYTAFVTQVDKSKLTIQQALDKLEQMKQALMQKYFN